MSKIDIISNFFQTSPFFLEKAREYRIDSIRATIFLDYIYLIYLNSYFSSFSHLIVVHHHPHVSSMHPSKWLSIEFPPPRVDFRNYFTYSRHSHIRDLLIYFRRYFLFFLFFFYLFFFFQMISLFPFLHFAIFFLFLFIQRIHRCGYTKLERYYFCLHVNNSMSRVVCNAIVNTRVSLVSISMSRSMVLSNVLTSNRSFERYTFALLPFPFKKKKEN